MPEPQRPQPQPRTLKNIIDESIQNQPELSAQLDEADLYRLGVTSQNPEDRAIIMGLGPNHDARMSKLKDAANAYHMAVNSQPGGLLERMTAEAAAKDPRTRTIRGLTQAALTFGSMGGGALGAAVAAAPIIWGGIKNKTPEPPAIFSPENAISLAGKGGQMFREAAPAIAKTGGLLGKGAEQAMKRPGLFGMAEGAATSMAGDAMAGNDLSSAESVRNMGLSALLQGIPSMFAGGAARAAQNSGTVKYNRAKAELENYDTPDYNVIKDAAGTELTRLKKGQAVKELEHQKATKAQADELADLVNRTGNDIPDAVRARLTAEIPPPTVGRKGQARRDLITELNTNPKGFIYDRLDPVFSAASMKKQGKAYRALTNITDMMKIAGPNTRKEMRRSTVQYILSTFANPKNPIASGSINQLTTAREAVATIFGGNGSVLSTMEDLRVSLHQLNKVHDPRIRAGMSGGGIWTSIGDTLFLLSPEGLADGIYTKKTPILGKLRGAIDYLEKIRKNPLSSGTTIAGATRELQKAFVETGAVKHDLTPSWKTALKSAFFQ